MRISYSNTSGEREREKKEVLFNKFDKHQCGLNEVWLELAFAILFHYNNIVLAAGRIGRNIKISAIHATLDA